MHWSILKMHLKTLNRSIVDVPGDNNCQFHAVADQLERIGYNRMECSEIAT